MKFMNVAKKFTKKLFKNKVTTALSAFGALSLVAAVPTFAATTTTTDFSTTTLPFTVTDMLSTATSFLGMYGQWIALVLGVLFAPVLYGLAMKLINAVRAKTAKN